MTFEEYVQSGRSLYKEFADVVASIIEASLIDSGAVRYQPLQKRAKKPDEVAKKLGGATDKIEDVVKDLAGARIVVYANSDIDRLDQAQIIVSNFDVDWDRTKFHYPRDAAGAGDSLFIGRNYVVRLKAERAGLPEYRRFAGLACEVQVQTILDHAWSETAHDTIYKSPKLSGVGAKSMARIRERMRDIQRKYLLPAGNEFQQVLNDFEQVASGQRLAESDVLAAISGASDNNVRVDLIENYTTVVLPIIDDVASAAPTIRAAMLDAARNAATAPVVPMETPIGRMTGHSAGDVLGKILKVLGEIRYVEPADSFQCYADLFAIFQGGEERTKVIEAVGSLAQHSLAVWRQYGPAVQEILLDAVEHIQGEQRVDLAPLIIEVAKRCLDTEANGITATSRTVTWETGAVASSTRLDALRTRAIALLRDFLLSAKNVTDRRRAYMGLKTAAQLPRHNHSDALLVRVFNDTADLLTFLAENVGALDDLLREKVEHDAYFHYRRAGQMPPDALKSEGVEAARDAVLAAALALRARYNALPDYVIFKTLVGFESVFDYEWDEPEEKVDFNAKEAFRKARVAELLTQVTEATADTWFARLDGYAEIESDDLAMFMYLGPFVADIGAKSSVIAATWLERSCGRPLQQFTPGLLRGLHASDRTAAARWMESAINANGDLSGVAQFLRDAEPPEPGLLQKAMTKALQENDARAVFRAYEGVCRRPDGFGTALTLDIVGKAIGFLSKRGIPWTDPLWLSGTRSGLFAVLDDDRREIMFDAFVRVREIDFRAEAVLAELGDGHVEQVIDVFGERIRRERAEEEGALADDRYDAVPHDFTRLHTKLAAAGPLLLPKALEWHREDPHLGQFKSARVVSNAFPDPPADVVAQLIAYARSNDRGAQDFVIDVMSNYDGALVAFTVLKELVAVLPAGDEFLRGVRIALGATGVMHGEFGHRDALEAEQSNLTDWLTDPREPVREFAANLQKSVKNQVNLAQQNAEEDIAMRKLDYGEQLDGGEKPTKG